MRHTTLVLASVLILLTVASHPLDAQANLDEGFYQRLALARYAYLNRQGESGNSPELIKLIAQAESYSEAILLVRVAEADVLAVPPVPSRLSSDPGDPDWEFDGYNVTPAEEVIEALTALRDARNTELDRLSDAEFDVVATAEDEKHWLRRVAVAALRGVALDEREDLYIASVADEVWRRKKPANHIVSKVNSEGPGGGGRFFDDLSSKLTQPGNGAAPTDPPGDETSPAPQLAGGEASWYTGGGTQQVDIGDSGNNQSIIIGNLDTRELRSEWNGFDMQSSAWQPKGAIIDENDSSNGDPINVDCTGVKIRQRLVASAGHCFYENGSWNSNRKWIPGADGVYEQMGGTSDPSPNGFKNSYTRIVRGPWYDHEWNNYDFGLFVLYDNSSSCSLYWHGWWKKSGLLNDTIHLYGYPGEFRDCDASPVTNDWCYSSIYGDGGTITYAGAYRVRYSIDTQPGQSGAGFYEISGGTRYVVGVHRGKWSNSRNDGVRINNGNRNMINDAKADHPPNACN